MNKHSVLLSISIALAGLLAISEGALASQIERTTEKRPLIAAAMPGVATALTTQLSKTPTTCAVTGKGRTRALCENSLVGSGTIAPEKSQYLSTVIVTTVTGMLIVIATFSVLSLALIAVAAWARRTRNQQPAEKTGASPSSPVLERPRSPLALRPTLWSTIRASLFGLAWLVGLVSLIGSIWLVWFI